MKPWREVVADRAWVHWRPRPPLTGPVGICCDFVLPRPKGLSCSAPTPPATKKHHDGDKMDRAVWDALSKVVYRDDSQITEWSGTKRIAEVGEQPGCRIQVWIPDRDHGMNPMTTDDLHARLLAVVANGPCSFEATSAALAAVLKLHDPLPPGRPGEETICFRCGDLSDENWPCSTVLVIAEVLGIPAEVNV